MEIVYERVAAIDVGKKIIAVAVRTPGERPGKRRQQVRKYNTFYQTLTEMVAWLVAEGVTHVTMEATGIYWKPIFHALCAAERPLEVLLVNARHVKNVPGRKSDALDAVWLAELTECGLLRGSFIPPPQIAAIRELTRYRKKLIEQRTSELQRLAKVLEDSGIKIDSVASKLTTLSARDMIEALIAGERDPAALANLARGRMRSKIPDLRSASLSLGRLICWPRSRASVNAPPRSSSPRSVWRCLGFPPRRTWPRGLACARATTNPQASTARVGPVRATPSCARFSPSAPGPLGVPALTSVPSSVAFTAASAKRAARRPLPPPPTPSL